MNVEVFKPTNRCFDDALDFLGAIVQSHLKGSKVFRQYRLAHGILIHPRTREKLVHAWVERNAEGGIVIHSYLYDGVLTYGEFNRKVFYELFGVQERTLYTIPEAWRENRKHNNYGPWKDKYRALALPRGTFRKDGVVIIDDPMGNGDPTDTSGKKQ